jgi:hypothetical protein
VICSGYDGGDIADEETLDERFLRTFYVVAEGQATRFVSGEELARELGMDPDGETDKARVLGTAPRGGGVRDSQQDRPRGARLHEPLVDTRRHQGGRGEPAAIVPVGCRGAATAGANYYRLRVGPRKLGQRLV